MGVGCSNGNKVINNTTVNHIYNYGPPQNVNPFPYIQGVQAAMYKNRVYPPPLLQNGNDVAVIQQRKESNTYPLTNMNRLNAPSVLHVIAGLMKR